MSERFNFFNFYENIPEYNFVAVGNLVGVFLHDKIECKKNKRDHLSSLSLSISGKEPFQIILYVYDKSFFSSKHAGVNAGVSGF
jgi:hypothetical protein